MVIFHSYVKVYQRVSLTIVDHTRRDVRPCSHHLPFLPRFFHTSLIQIHRDSRHVSIIFTIGSIMSHFSQDVPYVQSIPSLQKDLNLPPPPNNTYKGLLMVIFYLIQNTSGAKGPLSARKPRIRENQKFTSRTLPRLRGGLLKTRVVLPEKT